MGDAGEAKASTSRGCSGRDSCTGGLVLGFMLGADSDEDSEMSTSARRRTARWPGGGGGGGSAEMGDGDAGGSAEMGDGDAGENIGGGGGIGIATTKAFSLMSSASSLC